MVSFLSAEDRLASVERFVVGFMAQERELQHVVKDSTSIKKDLEEMKTSLQNVMFMCRVRAEERQLQDTVKYVESIKSEIMTDVEDIKSIKARVEEIIVRVPGNEMPQLTTGEEVSAEVAIAVHGAEASDGTKTGNGSNGAPAEQSGEDSRVIKDMPDGRVIKDMLDGMAAERFSALESRLVKIEAAVSGVSSPMQDCSTSASIVAVPNDRLEQVSEDAQTYDEHCHRFEYKVEESIYGLLALPGTPLRFSGCLLLLVLYTLTTGLVAIIYSSTVATANSIRQELYDSSSDKDSICQRVFQGDSYTWVCGTPTLANLMNFDKLDTDADGHWSVGEARNAGLLAQFRAINEVALEQLDVLEGMFPPVPPDHTNFCRILLNAGGNIHYYLSEIDQLRMFFVEEKHSWEEIEDILRECNILRPNWHNHSVWSSTAPLEWNAFSCIVGKLCDPIPIVPGNTSESLFYERTSFMAFMPKSLHEALSLRMLRPCRLIDPELCANVEHQAHSLLSEVWPDLPVDQAVWKCSKWVKDVCPRLVGEEFRAIQARMSVACGTRKYEVVQKTATTRVILSETSHVKNCEDPEDGGLTEVTTWAEKVFAEQPLLVWLARAEEARFGFDRGTVREKLNCRLGVSGLGFQDENLEVDIDNEKTTVADFFGRICPESSCVRQNHDGAAHVPIACPVSCLGIVKDPFNISFGAGDYTQTGRCSGFETEVDATSGSLKISRLQEIYEDADSESCRMILRLDTPARVYVTTWNVPDRQSSVSGDGLCSGDYIMIDGKRHCGVEKPAVVNLQPRPGPFEAVYWKTCDTCGEFAFSAGYDKSQMGFEMIITDASVPAQYPLVTVSFENHLWYWQDVKGVQRPIFHGFLVLIMLIWIGYLGGELEQLTYYVRFINKKFKSLMRKLLLLFCLALPRFLVWAFVLCTGILLLATANSFIDLVLNSVALAFVLEFDEYLFVMAVPGVLKEQIKSCDSVQLEVKMSRRLTLPGSERAYDVQITFRMLCFIVVAVVVVQALYAVDWLGSPHFIRISEVYDCLCALHGPNCPAY